MNSKVFKIGSVFIYGLILSAIVGLISSLFLVLVHDVSDYIWSDVVYNIKRPYIGTLLVLAVGSLIVGFSRYRWGNLPKNAHDAISELKSTKKVYYKNVYINFFIAFVILIFGAGVGPEAALLSSIFALAIWIADKMRYLYFNFNEIKKDKLSIKLKKIILPHVYLEAYDEDKVGQSKKRKLIKKIICIVYIVVGILCFTLLSNYFNQPAFTNKLGESSWGLRELVIFIPLVLYGLFYSKIYSLISLIIGKVFNLFKQRIVVSAFVGGLGIALVSFLAPDLLFSGQASLKNLASVGLELPIITLVLASILKLVFMELCLKSGWLGGNILPIIFASMLQGYAIALLFPSLDPIFIVAVVGCTTSLAILKSPFLGFFIMLYFPLNIIPIIIVIMILFIGYDKLQINEKLGFKKTQKVNF
ncbi:MAG: chloride channel protein [Erysipelotrichales bacterium]